MPSAVSVLRVSTKRQLTGGDGIENQRQGNTSYLRAKGYRLHREFVVAESAEDGERADFGAVLDYVVAHRREVDVVVFWKVDRISRGGVANYYALKSFLARHGVRIEFATEQIDGTPAGELMESVLAAMARFENRLRVDRTIGVERILTRDGYWCRAAPTGFANGRDAHGKPVLVPHPDRRQWELLRHGLRKQMSGVHTAAEVVDELRRKGFRTRRGQPLSKQSWSLICRSPVYGGLLCGKWTDFRFVRAKFDGPLTPAEWHQLQRVLDGRRRIAAPAPRQRLRSEFPLRRFLRCPRCMASSRGYHAVGRRGRRFLYYDCQNAACRFRVPTERAHDLFVGLLRSVTPSASLLEAFRQVALRVWQEQVHELTSDGAALRKQAAALREEKRALVQLMKRSCENSELLADLKRDYERVEKDLSLATAAEVKLPADECDAEEVVSFCTAFLRDVSELWPKWPVEAQSKVQRLVFPEGLPFDALEGKRTPQLSLVYAAFPASRTPESRMAPPAVRVTNQILPVLVDWYTQLRGLQEALNLGRAA